MSNAKIRSYSDFVTLLDNLAEGVKTHSSEAGFPATFKEEEIRQVRTDLEALRIVYQASENIARIKHDEYEDKYRIATELIAKTSTMLYGFYGKKNQVVADFGLVPHKSRPRGKAKVKTAAEPASN